MRRRSVGRRPCTRSSIGRRGKAATTGCSPTSWPATSPSPRQRERAVETAREWGAYLVGRSAPRPGARSRSGPNLAVLREALAEAGFDPRFRRRGGARVDITLRDCPFRDLMDEHRELVCALHRGLLDGMLASLAAPDAPRLVRAPRRSLRRVPSLGRARLSSAYARRTTSLGLKSGAWPSDATEGAPGRRRFVRHERTIRSEDAGHGAVGHDVVGRHAHRARVQRAGSNSWSRARARTCT